MVSLLRNKHNGFGAHKKPQTDTREREREEGKPSKSHLSVRSGFESGFYLFKICFMHERVRFDPLGRCGNCRRPLGHPPACLLSLNPSNYTRHTLQKRQNNPENPTKQSKPFENFTTPSKSRKNRHRTRTRRKKHNTHYADREGSQGIIMLKKIFFFLLYNT